MKDDLFEILKRAKHKLSKSKYSSFSSEIIKMSENYFGDNDVMYHKLIPVFRKSQKKHGKIVNKDENLSINKDKNIRKSSPLEVTTIQGESSKTDHTNVISGQISDVGGAIMDGLKNQDLCFNENPNGSKNVDLTSVTKSPALQDSTPSVSNLNDGKLKMSDAKVIQRVRSVIEIDTKKRFDAIISGLEDVRDESNNLRSKMKELINTRDVGFFMRQKIEKCLNPSTEMISDTMDGLIKSVASYRDVDFSKSMSKAMELESIRSGKMKRFVVINSKEKQVIKTKINQMKVILESDNLSVGSFDHIRDHEDDPSDDDEDNQSSFSYCSD